MMTGSETKPAMPPMVRRRLKLGLVVLVVALLLVGAVAAYFIWEGQAASSQKAISALLTRGAQSDYAYGSSVSFSFNLSNTHNLLRGAFSTNTSMILYVITSEEYTTWKGGPFLYPLLYAYYSTGDLRAANVSVSIPQGQWLMVLNFVNDTGRTVHTSNGTGIVSDTHLTITQTFTVAPESLQSANTVLPYGSSEADVEGNVGSNVTGRLSLNMSQAGDVLFQIDNETFSPSIGNASSSPQKVNWVVPLWVSVDTGNYSFSNIGPSASLGVQGSKTNVGFDQGSFPRIIPFGVDLSIQPGAPAGHYSIVLNVFASPLDGQGTPGMATFTIDLTAD